MVRLSLENSLLVALATVCLGTVVFFAVSYVVQRTRLRGRRVLDIISILPVALPGLIIGLGYLWTWISLPVDDRIVFELPFEDRWQASWQLLGVDSSRVSFVAGHA